MQINDFVDNLVAGIGNPFFIFTRRQMKRRLVSALAKVKDEQGPEAKRGPLRYDPISKRMVRR